MKIVLIFLTIVHAISANGQSNYNCKILEKIIESIDTEKKLLMYQNQIVGKYDLIEKNGIYKVKPKKGYENDSSLVNILNFDNIIDVVNVKNDSIFYLKKDNLVIDTFGFFDCGTNFIIGGRNFIVRNHYDSLLFKKHNIIYLYSLDSYRGYSGVALRHESAKSRVDKTIFLYSIEQNVPVIKKILVVHRNSIDINR